MSFILKNDKSTRKFGVVEKVEWCELVKSVASMKNIFAKKMIQEFKKLLPKSIFVCPLKGKVDLVDITLQFDYMRMMPKGLYIVKLNAVDKPQGLVVNTTSIILQQD